jgi:hypothetical protein
MAKMERYKMTDNTIPTPLADYYIDCLRPVKKSGWRRLIDWLTGKSEWKDKEEETEFVKFLRKSKEERECRKRMLKEEIRRETEI